MITKLSKIKKVGIFSDFNWDTSLQTFGRYNLIYGWNGSGKSTLANLFAGLPEGLLSNYPSAEYEIETDTGGIVKNGQPFPIKVRVFNRDYVANNVHTVSGKAKPILILGKENKKIADEIAADEVTVSVKKEQVRKLNEETADTTKRKDKIFSDIAKTIGLNTSGLVVRNYRKPDAERDFVTLSDKAELDEAEVSANVLELKQQEKPDVDEVVEPRFPVDTEQKSLTDFLTAVAHDGSELCRRIVESKVVERLKRNPDIALHLLTHEVH